MRSSKNVLVGKASRGKPIFKGAKLQTTKLYQCTLPSIHIYIPTNNFDTINSDLFGDFYWGILDDPTLALYDYFEAAEKDQTLLQ